MKLLRKSSIIERLVYIVIWLIVFLSPVMIAYWAMSLHEEDHFSWQTVIHVWTCIILPFFLLFCLNNFWLAPQFLLRKKYVYYTIFVVALLGLFVWVDLEMSRRRPTTIFLTHRQPFANAPDFQHKKEPQRVLSDEEYLLGNKPFGMQRRPIRPELLFIPTILHVLIAILMLGFNIAIKMIFKSLQDEEAMKEMEHRKLQSELEYLKYQINPHFFMNTLNNIHALVDVNKTQAKKAIVELSKMMRYVLYEADDKTIPISKEVLFLSNYIELMKLRYIEKVNVNVSLPKEFPDVEIPPLLYISFIENAFKHGVSYQSNSFIYVAMQVEEENLVFTCSNTNNGKSVEQHKGIGLENIQKRLRLLYNTNYTLSINESEESFNVLLIIPML